MNYQDSLLSLTQSTEFKMKTVTQYGQIVKVSCQRAATVLRASAKDVQSANKKPIIYAEFIHKETKHAFKRLKNLDMYIKYSVTISLK